MTPRVALLCFLVCGSIVVCLSVPPHKVLSQIADDPCNQWANCSICISNKFCGWCSNKVVYQDGSPGYQCAGFNPNNETKPFVCVGTYSTDKCAVGYNCSDVTKQCMLTDPGDGVPLDQCTSSCYPKTYSCSPTNVSCVETPAENGGIPLSVCQAQCSAQNSTPTDLLGHWRGLEISGGFIRGVWILDINVANASLYAPSGGLVWKGAVSSVESYVVITINTGSASGLKVYALYQTQIGPVTKWATIAASRPGAAPPIGYDDAMTSPSAQEFVFVRCLDASICNFGSVAAAPEKIRELPVDPCSTHANCTSCLDTPFCGWCSTNVIYQGNIIGANCAGFNQNGTDNPFVCVGTYSTQKCPIPPPEYVCNSTSLQCAVAKMGEAGSVCNATCGKNHSTILYKCNVAEMICEPDASGQDGATCNTTCQLRPFPVALTGVWRGMEVSSNYTEGEWTMVVTANTTFSSSFSLTNPLQITIYGNLEHIASEAVLRVMITSPVAANRYSLYELAYGPETSYLTLANGAADSETYPSFVEAMTGNGMSELNFVQCLNPTLCKF